MLDFSLTAEQQNLQMKARTFALEEVLPVAWFYDEKDELPIEVLRKAFNAGLIGGDIPKEYGGQGLSLVDSALITEEIAAACPGLATSIFDSSLGMEPILLSSNTVAKQKYLPAIANDFKLAAFATSEPVMGSDVAGIRCSAQADGEDYVLNGTKFWITNGGVADYLSVFATTDPKSRHKGICAFVVEMDAPGVRVGRAIPKMGQRCSNTVGINFKDVRVSKENILAVPGEGFVLAMKTFARTRPIIGSFGVGAARAALEYSLDYAKKRRAFGMELGTFQAIQFKLAEMFQKVETSRLLTWKAAWESDQQKDGKVSASISKLYATETALEVVNEALQIFGGYGYTKMFPIEKILRDVRLLRIYEGTSEIQRMILADYLLKEYKPSMPALEDLPLHRLHDPHSGNAALAAGKAWRCRICGHIHYDETPPAECPYCFFPHTAFKELH
ncbi:acyl-CoA dehydrogenase family protein [Desulforhopalus sp. IMCC35007]|uniref:acyl-CoA dehydrogenase family protein n=1 Tax=Desulforhopalus sp. IMCC35007 TaxID=2569543 RepID=UPI0010ADDCB5|nr:acyl-CoA dehydrogenase family protein [Desulforhopalus sp. IMCC35007]TKB09279.1 acyl-CoA dehydrogenase [Desulforhopalus sp. IMCC35007]